MKTGFYIPAWFFLILTLVSGIWLRLQWGWPEWMLFRADYLIHGHSHVALLGWVFLGIAGFILEYGTYRRKRSYRLTTGLGLLVTLVTIVLFFAFVRDGYAPLSITFSTIHMLSGYGVAWLVFRNARQDSQTVSQYFMEGAVFWMIIATAGTWLLAVGRGLPPFWMDAAVQFYLHVLFNGWMMFALAGLAYRFLITPDQKNVTWPFWLMMAGLVPALVPQLDMTKLPGMVHLTGWITAVGITGNLLYGLGGLSVTWLVIQSSEMKNSRWACKELLWTGLAGAVPVFAFPVAMSWPSIREIWIQSDFLVIGFIHLHLLMTVSTILIFAVIQRFPVWRAKRISESRIIALNNFKSILSGRHSSSAIYYFTCRMGSLLYIAGSVSMIAGLFVIGFMQIMGMPPIFPVQKVLFFTGFIAFTGVLMLTAGFKSG